MREPPCEVWTATDDKGKGESIAVDGSGNVYVAGTSIRAYVHTITTIKYEGNGNTVWNNIYRTDYETTGFTDSWGNGIAVDNSGNIYTVGSKSGPFGFRTIKFRQQ